MEHFKVFGGENAQDTNRLGYLHYRMDGLLGCLEYFHQRDGFQLPGGRRLHGSSDDNTKISQARQEVS